MAYGHVRRGPGGSLSSRVHVDSPERRVFGASEIESGWRVTDAVGLDVGHVAGLEGDFLVVSRGFGSARLYVPLAGVREVKEGRVRLILTSEAISQSRWAERPRRTH
jgi:hypothetical protein